MRRVWVGRWRRSRVIAIVQVGLLCLVVTALPLAAHGGGTPRLINAGEGPYRLFAWTQPEPLRAGDSHISIAVTERPPDSAQVDDRYITNDLASAVQDAEIVVTLRSADESVAPLAVSALPSTLSEFYYEVDLTLPVAGEWDVSVSATAELGTSEATYVVQVLPARQISWPLILLGVALVVALFAGLGLAARRRETDTEKQR